MDEFMRIDDDTADQDSSLFGDAPLALSLPTGFPLPTLLQFLPDIRVKVRIERLAAEARAMEVKGRAGLRAADEARENLRQAVADAKKLFDGTKDDPGPTVLANALHKRLTGLRADFVGSGESAVEWLDTSILSEQRRLDREAEEARLRAQAEADRQAKKDAEAAAREARKAGASPEVVSELKAAAKTAQAPPVHVPSAADGALQHSSTVEKFKARLCGTPDEAEPNPDTCDLTPLQEEQFRALLAAVIEKRVPLAAVCVDWKYVNAQANAQRATFDWPGLEAFKDLGLRSKGRR